MTGGNLGDRAFSSPFEAVLYACSRVYEVVVRFRSYLYERNILEQKSLPCKVVSVGNITVGGTGKTPLVHYIANFLKKLDLEVAVVSRGYGGSAQRLGGVVSDGKGTYMKVQASGDEPQLLASKLKGIPLLIGKDRYRTGRQAISRFNSSVLVLDDAFQHLSLKRDLNLLLLDSSKPFGNGYCIPRGTLREDIKQARRADALILTRWPEDGNFTQVKAVIESHVCGRPIFRCMHVPERLFSAGNNASLDLAHLRGRKFFLFSGIARNDSFHRTISSLGGRILGFVEFPDHHRYSEKDLRFVWRRAKALNVDGIITTEKDYINIAEDIPATPPLLVLTISVSFGKDTATFASYLRSQVGQ